LLHCNITQEIQNPNMILKINQRKYPILGHHALTGPKKYPVMASQGHKNHAE
jgi:hypothetical protein